MTTLVQITEREGTIKRVPIGTRPSVVEVHLEPHQQLVNFEWVTTLGGRERVTEDWYWRATIANHLEAPDG